MSDIVNAALSDGTQVPYVRTSNPPTGGMKHTFFAPDRSYVIQFFNDSQLASKDRTLRDRLEAIIGKYNPTVSADKGGAAGNTEQTAEYFKKMYCWPLAVVEAPEFGIMCPTYPPDFFFGENASIMPNLDIVGKDKRSSWFTSPKLRKYLAETEKGNFQLMLRLSLQLARALRRMHSAGLAHADLSSNNVLIDPSRGQCVLIDIDSLVVPKMYAPEVIGTRGYIAPEVLETMELDKNDPDRKLPCIATDLHSMAVLIYEYLMLRHPLLGPKVYSTESTEKDDYLALGPMATFIEDPHDTSNRPDDLDVTIDALGPGLKGLFLRAFVDGLHDASKRPTAAEWERELDKAWDLLQHCPNPSCRAQWFVMSGTQDGTCPFCGHDVPEEDRLQLSLRRSAGKQGQWRNDKVLTLYDGTPIFRWHVYSNELPNERADRTRQGYVRHLDGQWLFVNEQITGMRDADGRPVPRQHQVELKPGMQFLMSDGPNARLAEVIGP